MLQNKIQDIVTILEKKKSYQYIQLTIRKWSAER